MYSEVACEKISLAEIASFRFLWKTFPKSKLTISCLQNTLTLAYLLKFMTGENQIVKAKSVNRTSATRFSFPLTLGLQ